MIGRVKGQKLFIIPAYIVKGGRGMINAIIVHVKSRFLYCFESVILTFHLPFEVLTYLHESLNNSI